MQNTEYERILSQFSSQVEAATQQALAQLRASLEQENPTPPPLITSILPVPKPSTALYDGGKRTVVHKIAVAPRRVGPDPQPKRQLNDYIEKANGNLWLGVANYVLDVMADKLGDREEAVKWAKEAIPRISPKATRVAHLTRIGDDGATYPDELALIDLCREAEEFETKNNPAGVGSGVREAQPEVEPIKVGVSVDSAESESESESVSPDWLIEQLFEAFILIEQDVVASNLMADYDYSTASSTLNKNRLISAMKITLGNLNAEMSRGAAMA